VRTSRVRAPSCVPAAQVPRVVAPLGTREDPAVNPASLIDIVVVIIGVLLGAAVWLSDARSSVGFACSIAVAFIGAILLIAILRALPGRSRV
jgi:uncharacterized membrane protein YeaQ/YmgE (transglycosylase-associated protein family)